VDLGIGLLVELVSGLLVDLGIGLLVELFSVGSKIMSP